MALYRISMEAVDRAFAANDRQAYNTFRWRTEAEDWYWRVTQTQISDCQPTRVGFYAKGKDGNWNELSDRIITHPSRGTWLDTLRAR